jgi:glycosyltransferase involved in cell wall biosynthesis
MKLGIVYHMPFWRAADGSLREVEGSFARYVDSLAPYFDEISLCVPVLDQPRGEGTPIRATNVTLAALPNFEGPVHFYPQLWSILPTIARWVKTIDVLHCRIPSPAAAFAFALSSRPAWVLIVGDLQALLPTMPYTGIKKLLWRLYTAFEEFNVQRMANRSLAFANGGALAAKHSRPGRPVIETTTTTITARDLATRTDTCAGSQLRVLTVSRVDPRKGLRILPEVVQRLRAQGLDVSLDIVGPAVGKPGEDERDAIVADAATRGVGDRVRAIGAVPLEKLLPLYRDYDAFVLPTLPGEGIPRVLLEAMTNGTPIVTTRVAGIPSLIRHEVNGWLVDEPSALAVTEALSKVLTDGPLRRRLIANGYETARGFTLDAQAARMLAEVSSRLPVTLKQPTFALQASVGKPAS